MSVIWTGNLGASGRRFNFDNNDCSGCGVYSVVASVPGRNTHFLEDANYLGNIS
jgi:hypothetical protein